ncbi:sulfotransferase domain-containing protein [Alcanivorax sp. DP30]|uniref:sulfotransferase domain-containing protein n=1 Tax=Alcanivorax sp. DP30 TaxID=2606217 RepID=UPI001369E67B|nr:sulfotransferase domain-containing protein [Alcanivorax sp. DP30]MZR64169.1 hypothetical protein [Alcanivorax sp. DP30]
MNFNKDKPDFICLGAPRAGTTWLFEWLNQHPDVFIPEKEIHFYIKTQGRDFYEEKGISWYQKLFENAKASQAAGDIAAGYLRSENARDRIKLTAPNAKLIVMIRNPVERIWSDYQYRLGNRSFDGSFDEFLKNKKGIRALKDGCYAEQIKLWMSVFKKERFHFVVLDDVELDRQYEISKICRFIGVGDFVPVDSARRVNEAKRVRSRWLAVIYHKAAQFAAKYDLNFLRNLFRKLGLKYFYDIVNKAQARKAEMTNAQRDFLNNYYRNDIEELEILLGRDLSRWCS